MLCAPAGFGKTTALRDFVESERLDAVQFNVHAEDNTLFAFARGLSDALSTLVPTIAGAYPTTHERLLSSSDPVRDLADWFDAHLKRVVGTIVIDDLHHASQDQRVPDLLARLIDRTKSRISWIIGTRNDAGLPTASWIGYGLMDAPLGEDDLRFTESEAVAHAADHSIETVNDVRALHVLTEGWPIALTIALRTRTHATDFPTAAKGAREFIYRYLAEQVFERLTAEEQSLLLAMSIFPEFDAPIVEALGFSVETIEGIRATVSLIVRSAENTYRYHDLFRSFLEDRLQQSGTLGETLLRASSAIEARDSALALTFASRAKDQAAILRLLESHALNLIERGQTEIVSEALAFLSETVRANSGAALTAQAIISAAQGHFEIAEPLFRAAIELTEDLELKSELAGRYAIELVRAGRPCDEIIADYVSDEHISAGHRVSLLGTLSTSYARGGDWKRAMSTMETALQLLRVDASDEVRARLMQQATFVFHLSDPQRAQRYAMIAIELARRTGLYEVAARAYSGMYSILYEKDDVLGALAALDSLLECARFSASNQVLLFGLIATLGIEVERANDPAIEATQSEITRVSADLPHTSVETLLPARAMQAAWEADFARAHAILAGSERTQPRDDFRALRCAEIALYAGANADAGAFAAASQEANELLERIAPSARAALAHCHLALAELAQGHSAAAHRSIENALRIDGHFPRLRALAQALRTVHRVALGQTDEAALAGALEQLRSVHFGGMARLIESLPTGGTAQGGYALLTPSERAILELLVRGASTKDVANQTGRSPQTVDTHIRSICRKLECSGRRAAVALAVAQGWVKG